jgi:hypothetical protein
MKHKGMQHKVASQIEVRERGTTEQHHVMSQDKVRGRRNSNIVLHPRTMHKGTQHDVASHNKV